MSMVLIEMEDKVLLSIAGVISQLKPSIKVNQLHILLSSKLSSIWGKEAVWMTTLALSRGG
jgi:hypothetical protein